MSVHEKQQPIYYRGGLVLGLPLVLALAVAGCQPSAAVSTPGSKATPAAQQAATTPAAQQAGTTPATATVTVADQAIKDGMVTIGDVTSPGPGWIVIHIDASGKPGEVIGNSAVKEGNNKDVMVEIKADKATPTLFAMLHKDAGKVGTYEFPGADEPVSVDGKMVSPAFKVTGGMAMTETNAVSGTTTSTEAAMGPIVMLHKDAKLGEILAGAQDMTLYVFDNDTKDKSSCSGECASNWPPLTVKDESEKLAGGEGVTGTLAVITRDDGTYQVTINGMPLYYYAGDKKAGDTNGQGVGGHWWAVGAAANKVNTQ